MNKGHLLNFERITVLAKVNRYSERKLLEAVKIEKYENFNEGMDFV